MPKSIQALIYRKKNSKSHSILHRVGKTRDPKITLPRIVDILYLKFNKFLKIDNKQFINAKNLEEALKAKVGSDTRSAFLVEIVNLHSMLKRI